MWHAIPVTVSVIIHLSYYVTVNANDVQPSSDRNAIFEFQYGILSALVDLVNFSVNRQTDDHGFLN